MRGLITGLVGCAAMIAAVAFVLGLIGSLFATTANFGERLLIAAGVAAVAFVAALMLFIRDYASRTAAIRAVRRMLLARSDVSDADFSSHFPEVDPTFLGQIRQAVSGAFRVPAAKIHPGDNLRRTFRCDVLEPEFHSIVIFDILKTRKVTPAPGQLFAFHSSALNSFGDLAKEIQRILDGFDSGGDKARVE